MGDGARKMSRIQTRKDLGSFPGCKGRLLRFLSSRATKLDLHFRRITLVLGMDWIWTRMEANR